MFSVGDKIVYPMHGAGVVEKIKVENVLGEDRKYYILSIPYGDMKVMVPVDTSSRVGIRNIVSVKEMDKVVDVLKDDSSEMSGNWNRRYRENMEKLKTGDILAVAEVVRNLVRSDSKKKLSTGEKKMLSNAKQILVSEVILVKDMKEEEAKNMIERMIMGDKEI